MKTEDVIKITIVNPEGITGHISHKVEVFKNGLITYKKTYLGYNKLQKFFGKLSQLFSSRKNTKLLNSDGSLFTELISELDTEMFSSLGNQSFKSGNQKVEFTDVNNNQKRFIQWTFPEMNKEFTNAEIYFGNYIQKAFYLTLKLFQ